MCLPIKQYVFNVEREWESHGLQCAVVQSREGRHRCGYVRVPEGHRLHGKNYDDVDADVHGGLTFAEIEPCAHGDGTGWWFGFDCAHYGDASADPALPPDGRTRLNSETDGHFWTQQEVEDETERLAEQLAIA